MGCADQGSNAKRILSRASAITTIRTYDAALKEYYRKGPKPDWLLNYVSAYATMHPWEDFAETFAVYLDMISSLDTAANGELIEPLIRLTLMRWSTHTRTWESP